MLLVYIFLIIASSFLISISQVWFKTSFKSKISNIKDLIAYAKNRKVVYGFVLYLFSLVIYLFSLKHLPLSIAYPLFASSFIFVSIFSYYKLKEKISFKRILGIVFIFIGIVLISLTL